MTENEIINDYLALGKIQEAIMLANANGYAALAQHISNSVSFLNNKKEYAEYYSSSWSSDAHDYRIAGAQISSNGLNLDGRQTLALKMIKNCNPTTLLDLGCADGTFIFNCLHRDVCVRAVGVDPWIEGINWARDYAHKNFPNKTQWACGLFEDYSSPEEKYDCVHAGEVLEHVIDPVAIIQHAVSLMKPNGSLVVTVPTHRPPINEHERKILTTASVNQHVRHINLDVLNAYAESAGLEIVEHQTDGFGWVNLVARLSKKSI